MLSLTVLETQAVTQNTLQLAYHCRNLNPSRTQVIYSRKCILSLNLLSLAFDLTASEKMQDLGVALVDVLLWLLGLYFKLKKCEFHIFVRNVSSFKHHKHVIMFSSTAFWRFAWNRNNSEYFGHEKQKISLASQWMALNTVLPLTPAHIQTELCFCCN